MARKQTRVSISIKGLTAQRLEKLAQHLHDSGAVQIKSLPGMSTALEHVIAEACEAAGIPEETTLRPRPPRKGAKPGPKPSREHRIGGVHLI